MYLAAVIALSLALLLILVCIGLMLLAIADLRYERQVMAALQPEAKPTPVEFHPSLVKHLPEPVQRYFLHAIAPGTALAQGAAMEMQGRVKLGQEDWWPFTAQQLLVPSCGFIWAALARKSWWRINGSDSYCGGQGRMRWSLLGWFPVMRAVNANVARSAAGRLAMEAVLVPSALLDPGVRWEVNAPRAISAHFEVLEQPFTLGLVLMDNGAVAKVRALRWGPAANGKYRELLFGINIEREANAGGYTIPGAFKAGWELDEESPDSNLFFEAELLKVQWF